MNDENREPMLNSFEDCQAVAIIGMSGLFPGAKTLEDFWDNIAHGVESIRFFEDNELLESGIPREEIDNPLYIKGKGYVENAEYFDAPFFNITPREAEMIDPQQRCFLESSWEALEDAGYQPESYEGMIGVFGGVGVQFYLMKNILRSSRVLRNFSDFHIELGNDKDQTATRVSYKLNLKGPSIDIQSSCSTSLVAVHYACQSLLDYHCDIALGGGAYIGIPLKSGYLYTEGHILSSDGHVRTFDEKATGTNFSDGCGVVVLKRFEEALHDNDHIYAVIRGIAVNHDGYEKIGYTAPSVKGQSEVIRLAHSFAGTTPDCISFVETHGTGTVLGDPVEVAGLKEAFKTSKRSGHYCAIGSVKPNIGHSDAAAGVISLMKAALALHHQILPANINFENPNPKLELDNSPFFVNKVTRHWDCLKDDNNMDIPRRAGVSNFGIGGTNVHAILEEAPRGKSTPSGNPGFLFPLSAKTTTSLSKYTQELSNFIGRHKTISLEDTAFTLQAGRTPFEHRRFIVCTDHDTAIERLRKLPPIYSMTGQAPEKNQSPVFMFTGQGAQYVGMGKGLYETNDIFKHYIDICADKASSILSVDLREILFTDSDTESLTEKLKQTAITQPALFMIEYALAQVWQSIGVIPEALIGHSIGEYTAACLAGVMSLEDAVSIVCHRGRLMQSMPPGSMLAVKLPEKELREHLTGDMSIGVINTSSLCVVSGENAEIDELESTLGKKQIMSRRLHTSHAFHSKMMEPILDEFVEIVSEIPLHEPKIPFISNITGTWITSAETTNPDYWAQQLRQTVNFAAGITSLVESDHHLFLEVGPGNTLTTLASQHASILSHDIKAIPSLPHPKQNVPDYEFWLSSIGNLWINNAVIDWNSLYKNQRRRVSLPTYAFDKKRYWIEPDLDYELHENTIDYAKRSTKESNQTIDVLTYDTEPSDVENVIKIVLKDVLGHESINVDDNFFDLGGDSMVAAQFAAKVSAKLGVSIPLALFVENPTVGNIINSISKITPPDKKLSLVPIKKNGNRPALFCIHGGEGNVLLYRDLANTLPDNLPVYGLQSRGLVNPDEPYHSFEEMAQYYIKEIKEKQPSGPYHLIGYCLGGQIAFEIAHQLTEKGDKVGILALLESYNSANDAGYPFPPPLHAAYIWKLQNLWYHLYNLVSVPEKHGRIEFFRTKLKTESRRIGIKINIMTHSLLKTFNMHQVDKYPHIKVTDDNHKALEKYSPRKYDNKIMILRPKYYFFGNKDNYLGWKAVADDIDVFELNVAPHGSLVQPYVKEVGEILSKYLLT